MPEPVDNCGMNSEFDAIIVGGGLVGAACAMALSRQKLKVALVESQAASSPPDSSLDSRIYAISPGNMTWLETLGVRDLMDTSRICAIEDMQVQGDTGAQLALRSYEADVGSLGFIVENKVLQHALRQGLQRNNIALITGQACAAAWLADKAELTLQNGQVLTAQLLIAADGMHSWLRSAAGIAVTTHDYGQMGVVANFSTELAHAQIARQWFRQDGVLAWLPLPGKRISMVWSTSSEYAQQLLRLDHVALAETVAAAGNHELGKLGVISAPLAFPLNLQTAQALVKPRLALLGDAAHTIHPLAGQGVNLGFRDVIALAETLAHRKRQSVGDVMLLRRYERARKTDMMAMRCLTDGLYQMFASEQPVVRKIRSWGLRFVDRQAWVKKRLVKQAMF